MRVIKTAQVEAAASIIRDLITLRVNRHNDTREEAFEYAVEALVLLEVDLEVIADAEDVVDNDFAA